MRSNHLSLSESTECADPLGPDAPASPKVGRRQLLIAGASALTPLTALAQEWRPTRPVRIVVPFGAAGVIDVAVRKLVPILSESLGQPVIVDNKPGANAIIGTEFVVKSPPDGHTLLLTSSGHTVSPSLYKLPYDSVKDLTPITIYMNLETVLVVHSSVPANSVQELVALAKSQPGKLSIAAGTSILHLIAGIINFLAKTDITVVPYKGSGPSLQAVLAGEVSMCVDPFTALPHIRSGRLKPLAVLTETRSPYLPDVPTLAEAGLPLTVQSWMGLMAPAGTPAAIVNRYHSEINKALATPALRETMAAFNLRPGGIAPEKFAEVMAADTARWAKYVKDINFKIQ